jgi:hypothetical protein
MACLGPPERLPRGEHDSREIAYDEFDLDANDATADFCELAITARICGSAPLEIAAIDLDDEACACAHRSPR